MRMPGWGVSEERPIDDRQGGSGLAQGMGGVVDSGREDLGAASKGKSTELILLGYPGGGPPSPVSSSCELELGGQTQDGFEGMGKSPDIRISSSITSSHSFVQAGLRHDMLDRRMISLPPLGTSQLATSSPPLAILCSSKVTSHPATLNHCPPQVRSLCSPHRRHALRTKTDPPFERSPAAKQADKSRPGLPKRHGRACLRNRKKTKNSRADRPSRCVVYVIGSDSRSRGGEGGGVSLVCRLVAEEKTAGRFGKISRKNKSTHKRALYDCL